jgi:hypothetical protein
MESMHSTDRVRRDVATAYGLDTNAIEVVSSRERRQELFRSYGPPNAIPFSEDPLSFLTGPAGELFVDDERNGCPVAIVPPTLP